MGSAAVKAMVFAVMLGAAPPGTAGMDYVVPPTDPAPAVEDLTSDEDQPEKAAAEDSSFDPQQLFSTLGALALGVVGLVWVRHRRTAEL